MNETQWLTGSDPGPMIEALLPEAADMEQRPPRWWTKKVLSWLGRNPGPGMVRAGTRKLRLFLCAHGRHHLRTLPPDALGRLRPALAAFDVAEQYEDGLAGEEELNAAHVALLVSWGENAAGEGGLMPVVLDALHATTRGATRDGGGLGTYFLAKELESAVRGACDTSGAAAEAGEYRWVADLLREVVGNPFRPAAVDPAWLARQGGAVRKLAGSIYAGRRFGDMPILADALEEAGCTNQAILKHCREPGEHVPGCWLLDCLLEKS